MAGAQPVPANFNANDADNLEDVSPRPWPDLTTGKIHRCAEGLLTDPRLPDRKAICCQGYGVYLPDNGRSLDFDPDTI